MSRVMASASTTSTPTGSTTVRRGRQEAVELHRHHPGPRLGQGQAQRAQPGPDLQDGVVRPEVGQAGDTAHRVRVGHEVLAQGPTGSEAVEVEERRDVGARVGHQLTVTATTPELRGAS